jgi:hypothetical protein
MEQQTERASCLHYMARSRRQGCAPCIRRLHLDRVRFAIGWHLGITLGVCMSGFNIHRQFQTAAGFCLRQKLSDFHENGFDLFSVCDALADQH